VNPGKTRRLLVEGAEDKRVIPQVIEANGIPWGETAAEAIVDVEDYGGIENLLARSAIETELKASNLEALGIVLDADTDPAARWNRLRARCIEILPGFPSDPLPEGLVSKTSSGVRFGVWLMPDNTTGGMMESFLSTLIRPDGEKLWRYARGATHGSKEHGALFRESHADKAAMHTWLAWQDPPGNQLHVAVLRKLVDASSDQAKPFVDWFRSLFAV
jgi:hypothetical protein